MYQENVLGIITDNNFRHYGVRDLEAGLKFATAVKERHKDIPILIQTSDQNLEEKVKKIGASFLYKNSPRLLHDFVSLCSIILDLVILFLNSETELQSVALQS